MKEERKKDEDREDEDKSLSELMDDLPPDQKLTKQGMAGIVPGKVAQPVSAPSGKGVSALRLSLVSISDARLAKVDLPSKVEDGDVKKIVTERARKRQASKSYFPKKEQYYKEIFPGSPFALRALERKGMLGKTKAGHYKVWEKSLVSISDARLAKAESKEDEKSIKKVKSQAQEAADAATAGKPGPTVVDVQKTALRQKKYRGLSSVRPGKRSTSPRERAKFGDTLKDWATGNLKTTPPPWEKSLVSISDARLMKADPKDDVMDFGPFGSFDIPPKKKSKVRHVNIVPRNPKDVRRYHKGSEIDWVMRDVPPVKKSLNLERTPLESQYGSQMAKSFETYNSCGICNRITKSLDIKVCESCQDSMANTQWHDSHLG